MTTYTITDQTVIATVRARAAALAWINTFLATGDDDTRPKLYQTLCLESFFGQGVQLVATDGSLLFRTWIPNEGSGADWPLVEEVPDRSLIIMDAEGFGLAFMRSLLRVTNDEAHQYDHLMITTAPQDDGEEVPLGDEFKKERLTLRACGQRIDLRILEDEYPNWRGLRLGVEDVERVAGLNVSPRVLQQIGKIKGANTVSMAFSGESSTVAFRAAGVDSTVLGLFASKLAQRPKDRQGKALEDDDDQGGE